MCDSDRSVALTRLDDATLVPFQYQGRQIAGAEGAGIYSDTIGRVLEVLENGVAVHDHVAEWLAVFEESIADPAQPSTP